MKYLLTSIVFYMGLFFATVFAFAGKPFQCLLLLIPFFPLQNVIERLHVFPLGKDFIDILLIAIIIGWFIDKSSRKEKVFVATAVNKVIYFFIIYSFFSLLWSFFYVKGGCMLSITRWQMWKNYMILPLLFFIVVNNVLNVPRQKKVLYVIFISFLVMNHYTLNQIRWMSGIASRGKIMGTFVWLGPNELAAFYAAYSFVFLGVYLTCKKGLSRFFCLANFCVSTFIVLFLYSRGAYVAFLGGLLTIAFYRKKILIVILLLGMFFWQSLLPVTVVERIKETKNEEGQLDGSSQKRIEIWQEAINYFKESPVVGIGFSSLASLGLYGGVFRDTHNIYLKILTEQGLIGLFIFLLLLLKAFRQSVILYRGSEDEFLKGLGLGFSACIVSIAVSNFFGDRWTYLQLGAYFWVFLGLVVRGNMITQQEKLLTDSRQPTN